MFVPEVFKLTHVPGELIIELGRRETERSSCKLTARSRSAALLTRKDLRMLLKSRGA